MNIVTSKVFSYLYIQFNVAFVIILAVMLIFTKRRIALYAGLLAGFLYFIIDYGIFYMTLSSRNVIGGNPLIVLFWFSISYGFTSFVWMWLWLDRDEHTLEWSILIVAGWLMISLLSQNFGGGFKEIEIVRTTKDYNGVMALIMFVGYAVVCMKNIREIDVSKKIPVLWILTIGVLVQFAWEFILFITGIRGGGITTLVVNSLIETNLGMPYLYFIHKAVMGKLNKDGSSILYS